MKSATFPSLRVDPDLREAAEDVLQEGESLSSFVEQSVRAQIERRRTQEEFVARGLASREKTQRSGKYVSSTVVLKGLESRLAKAKKKSA
jgi:predicted transcriptional regulator